MEEGRERERGREGEREKERERKGGREREGCSLYNILYFQAIWFTETAGTEGMVFGNTDMWHGLGVMLDSFDNDGLVSKKQPGGHNQK